MSVYSVCANCGKRRSNSILEPCPHCGYLHPLTKYGEKLRREKAEKETTQK